MSRGLESVTHSSTGGIATIVDDDPHIWRALGMWLDLHELRATHHIPAASLMQTIHQENGKIILHKASGHFVSTLAAAVLDMPPSGSTAVHCPPILR